VNLDRYLDRLRLRERHLADAYRRVAAAHADEPDIAQLCHRFAGQCEELARGLPGDVGPASPPPPADGDLLDDLELLLVLAGRTEIGWTLAGQAARANRDSGLSDTADANQAAAAAQVAWLRTRLKQAAAQALTVTP